MKIRKALITCAGFGTRFLPITKTIQKEMLPILTRPMVDYVVTDCLAAGIDEIIFVVKENENRLVEHFYSESRSLKQHMEKLGKADRYSKAEVRFPEHVKFRFVTQTIADRYGTAIPVELARKYLEGEDAFLVFMGDDFIYNPNTIEAAEMIRLFEMSGAQGLVTCITKPEEELYRYGVAQTRKDNGFTFLTNLVEKPVTGTAPSNLINISKYIFTPKIFEILEKQGPDAQSGEYYVTDTATALAQQNLVVIYTPEGRYLDGGNVLNWLKANIVIAKDDPELNSELRKFISEEF
ncbi:MAG: UTP--glucose-1-phosphate uridylyltransferase [Patescibacteria group bacterium]|nr:MAG: UTP--glucose-1-phosphate uridylyltransferase [Patescibacteria group bacterium]